MMTVGGRVKIFISAHKETDYVQKGFFEPIQVGAGQKGANIIETFRKDSTGDNISNLNPRFCELTAQYWAWKNIDLDYYGFCHYRRYFSFNENLSKKTNIWGVIPEQYISEDAVRRHKITSRELHKIIDEYDIILPQLRDVTAMPNAGKNLRDQFSSNRTLHQSDLRIMLNVLDEKYPEYVPYAEKFLRGKTAYLNNMFIMRKELFNEYCEWLFDILFECDKRIDYRDYSTEAMRTPGHLAERLLNIFIMRLKDISKPKIKELPVVFFDKTEPFVNPEPAFKNNNIAIALSADDYYAPYLATVVESIKENSSNSYNYDIMVMNKNISEQNRRRIKAITADRGNFSIRFIDISRFEDKFKGLFLRGHFTIETWFRLLMPDIMPSYSKVLYMDSDLVTNSDVAELYNTDVSDYMLAACHDADTAGLYNGFEPSKKEYMDNVLKIKRPYEYFQAGVILFNLDEFRRKYDTDAILKYASSYDWQLLDQDVLNHLAQGRVKYVDMAWNVMYDWNNIRRKEIIKLAPKYLQDEYDEAHADPKILHYAGPDKPWNDPTVDYAELFWRYCKNSGYYEECLFRTLGSEAKQEGVVKTTIKKAAKVIMPSGTTRGELARKALLRIRNNFSEN